MKFAACAVPCALLEAHGWGYVGCIWLCHMSLFVLFVLEKVAICQCACMLCLWLCYLSYGYVALLVLGYVICTHVGDGRDGDGDGTGPKGLDHVGKLGAAAEQNVRYELDGM